MKTKLKIVLGALLVLTMVGATGTVEPTAFSLAKLGDQYVGVQSKDRIVQIRSERSVGALQPDIWYVVYYDPDAPLKAIQVKFAAGQKVDVSRPFRLLEPITGADKVLPSSELAVDSDKALDIARAQPLLANLSLRSTQFWLEHSPEGPRWKIKFWAAKVNGNGEADVGDVYVSTATGQIMQTDLHPSSVD